MRRPLFHVGKRRERDPAFLYCGPCRGFTEHTFHGERPQFTASAAKAA